MSSMFSSDEAFEGFCAKCAEVGIQGCAFAKKNSTAASLNKDVWDMTNVSVFFPFLYLGSSFLFTLFFLLIDTLIDIFDTERLRLLQIVSSEKRRSHRSQYHLTKASECVLFYFLLSTAYASFQALLDLKSHVKSKKNCKKQT